MSLAAFLDRFYRRCAEEIRSRGGRVIKFMGDACLATFEPDAGPAAIEAAQALVDGNEPLEGSANVHRGTVAVGVFGPDDDPRHDIVGAAVNDLFRMGGAAGIRISDAVLPGD